MRFTRTLAALAAALIAVAAAAAAPTPALGDDRPAPAGSPPTYDPAPSLELLKPAARAGIGADLGVASPADLPLYEIDQAIDDATLAFEGRLTLHWTNLTGRAVETLPLLLHPNAAAEMGGGGPGAGSIAVTEVAVDGAPGGPAATFATARPTLVAVRLAPPLAAGARIRLKVRYAGRLGALGASANDPFAAGLESLGSLAGAGAPDYGLVASGDGLLTLAHAYPVVAPFREGEFDTGRPGRVGDLAYNGVAAFRVRTVVPAGLRVVTNLLDAAPAPAPGGGGGGGGGGGAAELIVSRGAPVRDFVLVAGRDLERASVDVAGTRLTSVFRKRDEKAGRRALAVAEAALRTFERRYGPYPYVELDVVEASLTGGAGGVELSAMVLIAGMLYRPASTSTNPQAALLKVYGELLEGLGGGGGGGGAGGSFADVDRELGRILDFTVAHEVAHQWFAGLVGADSRRHPSLDEPLAQYAAALAIEELEGKDAGPVALDRNVKLNYAIYRALGGADGPVLREASTFRSTLEYAGLVYGKAPYLYVALRAKLGDERLDAAIRAAAARHRFRLATTAGWVDALEAGAGGPSAGVRDLARRFFEEAHGDLDLGLRGPEGAADFVLAKGFGEDAGASIREAADLLGLSPVEMLRMLLGGASVPDGPAPSGGIDPKRVLDDLPPSSPTPSPPPPPPAPAPAPAPPGGVAFSAPAVYFLPFEGERLCVQGNDGIISHNGWQRFAFDFAMPTGTTVYAARPGRVVATRADADRAGFDAPANHVAVAHDDATVAWYLHLKKDGVLVKVGQEVEVGAPLGLSGSTGRSLIPHLHFHVTEGEGRERTTIAVRFEDVAEDGVPRTGLPCTGLAVTKRAERRGRAPAPH